MHNAHVLHWCVWGSGVCGAVVGKEHGTHTPGCGASGGRLLRPAVRQKRPFDEPVSLRFELLHAPFTAGRGNVPPDDLDPVARQIVRIPGGMWHHVHEYTPVTFDTMHFAQLDVTVHAAMLHFSNPPLHSAHRPRVVRPVRPPPATLPPPADLPPITFYTSDNSSQPLPQQPTTAVTSQDDSAPAITSQAAGTTAVTAADAHAPRAGGGEELAGAGSADEGAAAGHAAAAAGAGADAVTAAAGGAGISAGAAAGAGASGAGAAGGGASVAGASGEGAAGADTGGHAEGREEFYEAEGSFVVAQGEQSDVVGKDVADKSFPDEMLESTPTRGGEAAAGVARGGTGITGGAANGKDGEAPGAGRGRSGEGSGAGEREKNGKAKLAEPATATMACLLLESSLLLRSLNAALAATYNLHHLLPPPDAMAEQSLCSPVLASALRKLMGQSDRADADRPDADRERAAVADADGADADRANADGADADRANADGADADRARAKSGGVETSRSEGPGPATERGASGSGEDAASSEGGGNDCNGGDNGLKGRAQEWEGEGVAVGGDGGGEQSSGGSGTVKSGDDGGGDGVTDAGGGSREESGKAELSAEDGTGSQLGKRDTTTTTGVTVTDGSVSLTEEEVEAVKVAAKGLVTAYWTSFFSMHKLCHVELCAVLRQQWVANQTREAAPWVYASSSPIQTEQLFGLDRWPDVTTARQFMPPDKQSDLALLSAALARQVRAAMPAVPSSVLALPPCRPQLLPRPTLTTTLNLRTLPCVPSCLQDMPQQQRQQQQGVQNPQVYLPQGHRMDLRLVRDSWRLLDPDIECLMAESNETNSAAPHSPSPSSSSHSPARAPDLSGVEAMGARLAHEVVTALRSMFGPIDRPNRKNVPHLTYLHLHSSQLTLPFAWLLFAPKTFHPLNPNLMPCSPADDSMRPYLPYLHLYLSFCGPQLGYLYHSNSLVTGARGGGGGVPATLHISMPLAPSINSLPKGLHFVPFFTHLLSRDSLSPALLPTADDSMRPYLPYLHLYLSFCGPHLGYMYHSNSLVTGGMWLLKRLDPSSLMRQLSFSDSLNVRDSCIYRLSQVAPGVGPLQAHRSLCLAPGASLPPLSSTHAALQTISYLPDLCHASLHFIHTLHVTRSIASPSPFLCPPVEPPQDEYVPYHSARLEVFGAVLRDARLGGVRTSRPNGHVAPLSPITNHHRATLVSWSSSAFPRRSLPLRGLSLHCQQPRHGCSFDGTQVVRPVRPHATTAGGSNSRAAASDEDASGGRDLERRLEARLAAMQEGRGMEMRQGGVMDRGMEVRMFTEDLPTQLEAITTGATTLVVETQRSPPDVDYLQELLAIQQSGPRNIGFFGTRNMGFMHQQLIEILSYAMIITNNHIYTSGAAGTNAAVIRGALRAEKAELLTVILPQSLGKQPPESQELLKKVENLVEKPHNDHLPLLEASRESTANLPSPVSPSPFLPSPALHSAPQVCNMDILSKVEHVICFSMPFWHVCSHHLLSGISSPLPPCATQAVQHGHSVFLEHVICLQVAPYPPSLSLAVLSSPSLPCATQAVQHGHSVFLEHVICLQVAPYPPSLSLAVLSSPSLPCATQAVQHGHSVFLEHVICLQVAPYPPSLSLAVLSSPSLPCATQAVQHGHSVFLEHVICLQVAPYPPSLSLAVLSSPSLPCATQAVQHGHSVFLEHVICLQVAPYPPSLSLAVLSSPSLPCATQAVQHGHSVFLEHVICLQVAPYPPSLSLAVLSSPSLPCATQAVQHGHSVFLEHVICLQVAPYPPSLSLAVLSSPSLPCATQAVQHGHSVFLEHVICLQVAPYPPSLSLAVLSSPSLPCATQAVQHGHSVFLEHVICLQVAPYPPSLSLAVLSSPSLPCATQAVQHGHSIGGGACDLLRFSRQPAAHGDMNIELLDPNEELPSAKVTQGRTLGVAGAAASRTAGLGLGLGAGLALKLETDVMVRFGSHSTFCDAVKALARHAVKKEGSWFLLRRAAQFHSSCLLYEGSWSLARVQLEINGGDYFDDKNLWLCFMSPFSPTPLPLHPSPPSPLPPSTALPLHPSPPPPLSLSSPPPSTPLSLPLNFHLNDSLVQLVIDGGDYFDERNVRRRRFTREQRAEEERQQREREERRKAERERAERERKEVEERKAREEEERVRR
ncbi:unnamed protein product [Closterium sp. Naga37s-1]|nr:unnamed protein product [Closterium sp. Naga37s-1]